MHRLDRAIWLTACLLPAAGFTYGESADPQFANLLDADYITYYSQVYEFAGDTRYFTGRGRSYTLSWQREF